MKYIDEARKKKEKVLPVEIDRAKIAIHNSQLKNTQKKYSPLEQLNKILNMQEH